ncbi:hypothetical protein Nepgr_009703 [Nepenthes gracilis]|uniref:Uncharacterized protein n=1 Tax=Nepenthes gracilis TaxID=150966 RepID=A0AAD3SB03_NEPGR|nr:hypothetical protein Nepgr_009703 [Nepenthes gracilis]
MKEEDISVEVGVENAWKPTMCRKCLSRFSFSGTCAMETKWLVLLSGTSEVKTSNFFDGLGHVDEEHEADLISNVLAPPPAAVGMLVDYGSWEKSLGPV